MNMNPLISSNNMAIAALFGLSIVSLSMPQSALAEAKMGDRFGDWVYECSALAENKTACSLSQTIATKDNKRIAKFSLGRNEKTKSLDLVALLPLGINLPAGASLTIDTGKTYPLTLRTCFQQGCIATYTTDSSFIKALQSGQKLNLTFTLGLADKPITINGSLKGFADGTKAANLG